MRKFYALFFTIVTFAAFSFEAQSQSVAIEGTGTSDSHLYGPIYSWDAAPRSYRSAFIYPQTLLAGMPAASLVTQLQLSRADDGISLPAGNNLKLYLMNTTANDWGTGDLTWDVSGAVLVYDGDPSAIIGSTSGYKAFPLMQPFSYTGGNLALFSEYSQVNAPADALGWHYNTSTTQPAYSDNQSKWDYNSNTTLTTVLGSSSASHANMIIGYMASSPCTAPPVAGETVTNPSTAICNGETVTLNLVNNSSGTGQTYQWQYAETMGGPFYDIDTASSSSFYNINPTSSGYYRAKVTCGTDSSFSIEKQVVVNPMLSGTFTVNSGMPTGSGNFQTIGEAINHLRCGINGPVVIDIMTGYYAEQITLPAIPGASATNTIRLRGNMSTLAFNSTTSATRAGITIDGGDHYIIDSLFVDATAGTYGWGILLTNGADHNVISNNTITTSTSSTSTNYSGIVITGSNTSLSSSGNNGNYNLITNNTVNGGYYGISAYGSTSTYNVGNVINNNVVNDYYYYSIYSYGNHNVTISKNNISRQTRSNTSSYSLYISSSTGVLAEKNRLHDLFAGDLSNTSTIYVVYITGSGLDTAVNRVENNAIYNINKASGTLYGVYAPSDNYWNYYHNTIVLDDQGATAGSTYGLYVYGSDVMVKNNIVYITRGGTGTKYNLYFSSTGVTSSDNNVLFMNAPSGTNNVGYHSVAYPTLTDWQNGPAGYDQFSSAEDPIFMSPQSGDLLPMQPNLNNIGANVGVPTDIVDTARNIAAPDPGAYEFKLPPCVNPPVAGIISAPSYTACAGSNLSLDLMGTSQGENLTIQWQVSTDSVNYTNIGTPQTITNLVTMQDTSSWYRAMVVCSGGAPVYSDTVKIVTPAFVSGTYTINSGIATGGGNFSSFTEAINHIRCGINGPVIFNVAPGTAYNEQVIIPAITGTSPTNTIVINGNGAMISYVSTSSSERAVIKLDGTDYVTIDSLTIQPMGSQTSEYGYGIHLVNDADNNRITRNTIYVTTSPATASSSAFAGIVVNSAFATSPTGTGDSQSDSNYIANNRITGGYSGIALTASGTTYNMHGNRVMNNKIEDFYNYGIYLNGNHDALVEGNDISRPTRTSISSFYGVYLSTGNEGVDVSRNRIHDAFNGNTTSTSAAYGVYMSGSDSKAGNRSVISNNMVYGFNNSGTQYGFYNSSSDSVSYYYNSVLLDGPATTSTTYDTRGFYQTTQATGLEYKNNIVYISRAAVGENHAIYMNTASTDFVSNNNNFYVATTSGMLNNVGYYNGSQYAALTDWQTGTGHDMNSYSVDPMFAATNDLHLLAGSPMDDKGAAVGVMVDIDGDTRDANIPDIGADEMPLSAGRDLQTVALISPVSAAGCYNTDTVIVQIKNNSLSPINFALYPATVSVQVGGAGNATLSGSVNDGTLASGQTMDVPMTSPTATVDMSAPGDYVFAATTSVQGDVNSANDAMPLVTLTKTALSAGSIHSSNSQVCVSGTPELNITNAAGYSALQWQQSTTSGTGFTNVAGANDTTFTAPAAITQTTYYRLVATCGTQEINSQEYTMTVNSPMVMNTTADSRCGNGQVTLTASGSAGTQLNWYADSTGGSPIYTGPSLTTNISSDTAFYVSASLGGNSEYVGPVDPTFSASAAYNYDYYVTFDVLQPTTIVSVDVFPTAPAGTNASIEVLNSAGTVLHTIPYTTTVTGGNKETVMLNVAIAPGTDYRMRQGVDIELHRNSAGATYPYTSSSVSITGHSFTSGPTYYYFFYNWHVSTGCESARTAVAASVTDCPVPVTLVNFTGEKAGEANRLLWTTATEANNAGFELQRSADGRNFSKLAFVATQAEGGNSNSSLTYRYNDEKPFAGNSYYRLKQLDKDGKATLSQVVVLRGARTTDFTISSVYPNPAVNVLNMVIASPASESVNLLVTDVSGKVVLQQSAKLVKGDNQLRLDVNRLASGTYLLKAVCATGCESAMHKFVKQ